MASRLEAAWLGAVAVWLALIVRGFVRPPRGVPGCRAAATEALLTLCLFHALLAVAELGYEPLPMPPAVGGPPGLRKALTAVGPQLLRHYTFGVVAVALLVYYLAGGGLLLLLGRADRERDRRYIRWCRTPAGRAYRVALAGVVSGLSLYFGLWSQLRMRGWV